MHFVSFIMFSLFFQDEMFSLSQVKFSLQHKEELERAVSSLPLHDLAAMLESENNKQHFKNTTSVNDFPSVLKRTQEDMKNYLVKNVSMLKQIAEYFEPFDAALNDLSGKDEPNFGKLMPWLKTLSQYACDGVDRSSANAIEGIGNKGKSTCSHCCGVKSVKNSSIELTLESKFQDTVTNNNNEKSNDNSAGETVSQNKKDLPNTADAKDCVNPSVDNYSKDIGAISSPYPAGERVTELSPSAENDPLCLSLGEAGRRVSASCLTPHPLHYIATFLTPQFKRLAMLSNDERNMTYSWIKEICSRNSTLSSQFWKTEEDEEVIDSTSSPTSKTSGISEESTSKRVCSPMNSNPTLKALLEYDSSSSHRTESPSTNHPTLVSLLESSGPTDQKTPKRSLEHMLQSDKSTSGFTDESSSKKQKNVSLIEEGENSKSKSIATKEGSRSESPLTSSNKSRFTSIAHFMQSTSNDESDEAPVDIELQR